MSSGLARGSMNKPARMRMETPCMQAIYLVSASPLKALCSTLRDLYWSQCKKERRKPSCVLSKAPLCKACWVSLKAVTPQPMAGKPSTSGRNTVHLNMHHQSSKLASSQVTEGSNTYSILYMKGQKLQNWSCTPRVGQPGCSIV